MSMVCGVGSKGNDRRGGGCIGGVRHTTSDKTQLFRCHADFSFPISLSRQRNEVSHQVGSKADLGPGARLLRSAGSGTARCTSVRTPRLLDVPVTGRSAAASGRITGETTSPGPRRGRIWQVPLTFCPRDFLEPDLPSARHNPAHENPNFRRKSATEKVPPQRSELALERYTCASVDIATV